MIKENKKEILVVTACVLAVILVLCKVFYPDAEINNTIGEYQNKLMEEIKAIDENVVVEDITENEEISSTENTVEKATIEDERELEIEEVTEVETFELENEETISYDGDKAKSWNIELGDYQGLTYFSQLDRKMEE